MICIYHSRDLDGYTSGAIIKKWHEQINDYPDNIGKGELKLIGYDYGQPIPWEQIPAGEPIIMVDVSVPFEDMEKMATHSNGQFTWIDHHRSAILGFGEKYGATIQEGFHIYKVVTQHSREIVAILQDGIAACEITWKHLFPNARMPDAVKFLGQYDTWRQKEVGDRWDMEILPFQFGMRLYCNSPETFPMDLLGEDDDTLEERMVDIINEGITVLKYQAQVNTAQCKKAAFEYTWKGLRCICLNNGGFNSDVFKSVYDSEKHDIMMPFQYTNQGFWTFSLYSTHKHIDCGAIAKEMKGGGHFSAAGFQVSGLLGVREVFENMFI